MLVLTNHALLQTSVSVDPFGWVFRTVFIATYTADRLRVVEEHFVIVRWDVNIKQVVYSQQPDIFPRRPLLLGEVSLLIISTFL